MGSIAHTSKLWESYAMSIYNFMDMDFLYFLYIYYHLSAYNVHNFNTPRMWGFRNVCTTYVDVTLCNLDVLSLPPFFILYYGRRNSFVYYV